MSLPVHYERERCYMSELDEARTLMDAGDRDLSALRGMEDTSVFADEIVGFHVQQAAEKFLKAWLVLWSEPYPLTPLLKSLSMATFNTAGRVPFFTLTFKLALFRRLFLIPQQLLTASLSACVCLDTLASYPPHRDRVRLFLWRDSPCTKQP